MATIYKEILIDAPPDHVWDALRDFGALHERLVPGFVVAAEMRGDVRVITFFNGSIAQERLVGTDDDARRLAYTVIDGPLGAAHHHASAQVLATNDGRSRFVWVTDVLPDELAAPIHGLMDQGIGIIKETLEARNRLGGDPDMLGKTVAMPELFTIGEFSRTTHLSVKALRHYHDVGLLEPVVIDEATGYRSYAVAQVPLAQVIRRLRDLDMPLDQVRAVLDASQSGDVAERDRIILVHLERMERQLEQTQTSVSSLRALLEGGQPEVVVEHRSIGPTPALAIRAVVAWDDAEAWLGEAFVALHAELDAGRATSAGPDGALYASEFFEAHAGEVVAFVPITGAPGGADVAELVEIPAAELAVTVHRGAFEELDQAYAVLGSFVAARAIGAAGPIREHYLDPDGDDLEPRTEVAWPVSGPFS